MNKAKRISCFVLAVLMLVSTMIAMIVPSSAATSSNGKKSVTITVTTQANWWRPGSESITLSQTKGTCQVYNYLTRKTYTSKVYAEWDISVKATDGSHSYSKNWKNGSITLNLKPNKTYKITITWDETANILRTIGAGKGDFTTLPTWKVSKTHKCSNYY